MICNKSTRSGGFSLIELVIVVVIIGIISAIAIPRMTRGVNNAGSTALRGNLSVLRSALELYRAEHEGRIPTLAGIVGQLTQYTKIDGTGAATMPDPTTGVVYGPYVRDIPPLPVGLKKGSTTVAAAVGAGVGWVYNDTTGTIISATADTELNQDGGQYNLY